MALPKLQCETLWSGSTSNRRRWEIYRQSGTRMKRASKTVVVSRTCPSSGDYFRGVFLCRLQGVALVAWVKHMTYFCFTRCDDPPPSSSSGSIQCNLADIIAIFVFFMFVGSWDGNGHRASGLSHRVEINYDKLKELCLHKLPAKSVREGSG